VNGGRFAKPYPVGENEAVSTTFPRTSKKARGYSAAQVEEFLASARRAYDATDDVSGDAHRLSAVEIRHTAFAMEKGGYSPEHVDAALERLEDAFALRERERAGRGGNREAWLADVRSRTEVLLRRLGRPPGHRFSRTSFLSVGYHRSDVDRFTSKLAKHFKDGFPVSVEDVRTAVFRPQRGGYREIQVDLVLDEAVDLMLAVR
jgi:DivIVA domain-containing protein